jgi:hypothetical protein
MLNQMGGPKSKKALAKKALKVLREKAQKAGFPDVLIGGCIPQPYSKPKGAAIKLAARLGYNFFTAYAGGFDADSALAPGPHDYSELLTLLPCRWHAFSAYSPVPYAPIVMQGWDRRPIGKRNEPYFINKSP